MDPLICARTCGQSRFVVTLNAHRAFGPKMTGSWLSSSRENVHFVDKGTLQILFTDYSGILTVLVVGTCIVIFWRMTWLSHIQMNTECTFQILVTLQRYQMVSWYQIVNLQDTGGRSMLDPKALELKAISGHDSYPWARGKNDHIMQGENLIVQHTNSRMMDALASTHTTNPEYPRVKIAISLVPPRHFTPDEHTQLTDDQRINIWHSPNSWLVHSGSNIDCFNGSTALDAHLPCYLDISIDKSSLMILPLQFSVIPHPAICMELQ